EALSKTNAKRVHIQGCADLSELSEVRDIQKTENGTSFLYGGDINNLLRVLSKHDIEDLSVSEPDLEEIFMHYYSEGGEAK
ncbi:MAG: ABC transporter ATP-binding protein, partial [Clostridiaceae bacterium]|nr:ABC transporter ATP-binding protein [Clostridiaceae bacterium]